MTAPGDDALLMTLLAAFLATSGYVAGRLHQWHRTAVDRDEAYRDGYDEATRSTFSLAARLIGPRRPASAAAVAAVPPGRRGRHHVPDELVEGPTYRLPSDRVARAKVPGSEGAAVPLVPKPRQP
ncbi:hypothetical protein [Symbioplanes lichenis]|uniref:hypothetical protein n=1 Tax=Symbioplanes lichenis TaxID=1629072 RepID=UPI00273A120A|nr:hypothetical protein [Actinoplanes lichenis]